MALLDQVIDAYGGMGLWRSIDTLTARLSFGGLAFASRFKRARFDQQLKISTREPRVVFEDYPQPNQRGIFTPDRVSIETGGKLIAQREQPRAAFRELRRQIWWDDLDLLYFAGYASWNYFSAPFLLAADGVTTDELEPWHEKGESWRRLAVHFPETVPTHSRWQTFYFDEHLRIRRFDYDPEVFASWAKAAHYCFDERDFSGLLVPTKRRVFPRTPNDRALPFLTLVWIEVHEVILSRNRTV
jgi:hypothetical protein